MRDGDDMSALAAIHALSAVDAELSDALLTELVADSTEPFAAHAAWALGARRPNPAALAALDQLSIDGGFSGMLAERTLIEWSRIEALPAVRGLDDARVSVALPTPDERGGIVVIQPCLHSRIDVDGANSGRGDSGGIASLLRSLGGAIAAEDDIEEVITVTRATDSEPPTEWLDEGHRVVRLRFGPPGTLPWREVWAYRVEIERQLMVIGRSRPNRRIVWHLRMADVGTLAAAATARLLGQRVVFTVAPDPHVVVDAMQDSGRLDRARFAVEEAAQQFWFRARMVERIAARADHLVLLPRPTIQRELVELVGIDEKSLTQRSTVVPEGIDTKRSLRAQSALRQDGPARTVKEVLELLPAARQHLPWLITVGRLHPSKGAQRLVEAVAGDDVLTDSLNVVVVGGDLRRPTADERSTIERIQHAAQRAPSGLVTLTGHLPPDSVADLLAFVAEHGGVYVCASDKEEFGLAIVEALAAGAVVVAPHRGGAGTYVVDGDNGVLCDTTSISELRAAISRAARLTDTPGRAERARAMVRDHLGIEGMAAALCDIYRRLTSVTAAV